VNRLSKMLLRVSWCGMFAETALAPLYTALANRFGGDLLDAGIGYAIFSVATGIFVMIAGSTMWFEKNKARLVFWGFIMAGCCDLLYLIVVNKWQFFAVQVGLGLAIGMLDPAWDGLYSEQSPDNESHGRRWAFASGGQKLFMGLAALTGGLIVSTIGFRWLFIVLAIVDALAVYFAWRVLKTSKTTPSYGKSKTH